MVFPVAIQERLVQELSLQYSIPLSYQAVLEPYQNYEFQRRKLDYLKNTANEEALEQQIMRKKQAGERILGLHWQLQDNQALYKKIREQAYADGLIRAMMSMEDACSLSERSYEYEFVKLAKMLELTQDEISSAAQALICSLLIQVVIYRAKIEREAQDQMTRRGQRDLNELAYILKMTQAMLTATSEDKEDAGQCYEQRILQINHHWDFEKLEISVLILGVSISFVGMIVSVFIDVSPWVSLILLCSSIFQQFPMLLLASYFEYKYDNELTPKPKITERMVQLKSAFFQENTAVVSLPEAQVPHLEM